MTLIPLENFPKNLFFACLKYGFMCVLGVIFWGHKNYNFLLVHLS